MFIYLSDLLRSRILPLLTFFFALNLIGFRVSASVLISGGTTPAVIAGNPYTTLASAISALNTSSALTAPVLVEVSAGHTETLSGRISLTISGTLANPITIQKSGLGANPKLLSYVGTNATATSISDGMFAIVGCDYVTIDGIDLQESVTNTTPTTVMEFGYGLFKSSTTDGAQYNMIKNCTITLNPIQNTNWGATGHSGSVGIIINNTLNTSNIAVVTANMNGSNSFNKMYSNTISKCNAGIALIGYTAPSPNNFGDAGNDVGGNSSATGNTILNFGGATAASFPANGIFAGSQWDFNCSFNTIINNNGAGVNHPNILRGIFLSSSSNGASVDCNNNFVNVKGGGSTHDVMGISVNFGNIPFSNTVNVNDNNITAQYPSATTGILRGLHVNSSATNVNIKNNNIHDINYSILANAGAGSLTPIYNQGNALNVFISGNTVNNVNRTGFNSGGIIGIYCGSGVNQTIKNNFINSLNNNGPNTSSFIYGISVLASGTITCDSNQVSNLSMVAGNALSGIRADGTQTSASYSYNTIYNLTHNGINNSFTHGFYSASSGPIVVSNNDIHDIVSYGKYVLGIIVSVTSGAVVKNKIYEIVSNSNASPTVSGIMVGYVAPSGTCNIHNNLVGLLKAPFSTVSSSDAPTIQGISLGSPYESNFLLSDNTIYISASSTGTNFGAAGVYHTTAFTDSSNIGNLTMRNNVIYNNSIASGIGIVAAYQRSSSNKRTYNSLSDRNLFYAGIPSTNQLIFTDTVVFNQTLSAYKNYMSVIGADQQSYTGNVAFQSIIGSNPDFLKFDILTPSILESAGSNILGITEDYAGTIRQGNSGYIGSGSMPDLGAWELNGIALSGCVGMPPSSNTIIDPLNQCSSTLFTLSLSTNYGLGYSMQWEESLTGSLSGYTSILGATNLNLITSSIVTKWYRCIITCVASGQSVISAPIQVLRTPLVGNYFIDNTGAGNYLSVYDAIIDLNCKGAIGPVIFNLTAGQVFNETNNLIFTYTGTLANPITFKKFGSGGNPIIKRTGTSGTNDFIVKLNGIDYYTFDGIDFEQNGNSNANYVEYGIHILNANVTNGSQYNTFRNCVVSMTNLIIESKGVYIQSTFSPSASSGCNSYNRFLNMTVQNSFEGYRLTQSSQNFLDEMNEINIDTIGNPLAVSLIQNIGSNILGGAVYGVYGENQKTFKFSNTEIKNLTASGVESAAGIVFSGNPVSSVTVINNHFHDFFSSNSVAGISLGSVVGADVINNVVYNMSSTGFASTGISVVGSTLISKITNNRVYNLSTSSTIAGYALGIQAGSGLFTISNNMISDLHAGATTNTTGGTKGISLITPSSTCRLYHNSIYLNDIGTVAAYTSAGIYIAPGSTLFDIRNNVIVNKSNVTIGTRAAALWKSSTADNIDNACNNNLWYAGTPSTKNLIYYNETTSAQTIAAYKLLPIISPAESNAVTENVSFAPIMNGILRANPSTPTFIEGGAQVINDFMIDFEGDTRNVSAPDRGADEGNFTSNATAVPSCALNLMPANAASSLCSYQPILLKWSAPNNGVPVSLGYDIYFGASTNPPFLTNVPGLSYAVSGLNPNTLYYWKVVPKNFIGDAIGCAVQTFSTTDALITSTTTDSVCGQGSVLLNATGTGNILWYNSPSGGNAINIGGNFNTPILTNTTTYYVETGSGSYVSTGARTYPSQLEVFNTASSGLVFDAFQPFMLNTVDVYSTVTGGAMTVQLQDNNGTILQSASVSFPAGGSSVPKTITLNFNVPAGTGLRLLQTTSFFLVRETTHLGFPYPLSTLGNITGGYTAGSTSSSYFNFYNWQINSSCVSPRQPVIATVTPPSVINTTVSACDSFNWSINGMTYTASGVFDDVTQCDTQRLILTIHYPTNSTTNIIASNSYTWNENGMTYTNSGVYIHTYINSLGCIHTSTLNLNISYTTLNSVNVVQDQSVSCYGLNDGSCEIIVVPNGNYSYQLDGGVQTNSLGFFSSLTPGIHTVCVSDGINTLCDTVLIYEPDSLHIQFVVDSLVSCHGNDGKLSAIITGGTNVLQNYLTYWTNSSNVLLNPGQNNFDVTVSNLPIGSYSLTIEDDHGCFLTRTTTLNTEVPLVVSATYSSILCNGGASVISPVTMGGSGVVSITVNGLALQANYLAGTYTIVATDARACTSETIITITEPGSTNSTLSVTSCDSFTWAENGMTYTSSGSYTHTNTNSMGCVGIATLNVSIHQSSSTSSTITAMNSYAWLVSGITYSNSGSYTASFLTAYGCDSIFTLNLIITGVSIAPKVFLSGPYDPFLGLMSDSLRANSLLPSTEPYSNPPFNKPSIGGAGGEVTTNSILSITGNDAIVDWVFIELRSSNNPSNIIATKRALLQRDGDVVNSLDGISSLYFENIPQGDYYVSVKHRNHLGVMTALPLALNATPTSVDFTSSLQVYSMNSITYNAPRKIVNAVYLLWSGDANNNKNVKYNGTSNDKNPILSTVGFSTPNNTLLGYRTEDVNMDGKVKYNNADNDKNFILSQLGVNTPNSVFSQHMTD